MSVTFQSKELFSAFTCPIGKDLLNEPVNLFPCCHKVNETAAERFYGKMVGGSCELKDKTCVVCQGPVTGYGPDPVMRAISAAMSAATVGIFGLKKDLESELVALKEKVKLPYPYKSTRFKGAADNFSKPFAGGMNGFCRSWQFDAENKDSPLNRFVLEGFTDGRIKLVLRFKENSDCKNYLLKHSLICKNNRFCFAQTHEEIKTLFSIIAFNNELPYPQFYILADIVKKGCCMPVSFS